MALQAVLLFVITIAFAGCIFSGHCGADFDVERGALIRCEEGGRINRGWVEDPESDSTVFNIPFGLPDSVSTIFIVPAQIPPPRNVTVAELKGNKEYWIILRQGDRSPRIRIWTNAEGIVDSMYAGRNPCNCDE